MPTTTPSGRTRLPTLGDVPDIPADLLNLAYDLEMLLDAQHPNKWIKRGRVDVQIEGNGHARVLYTSCFFGEPLAPPAVMTFASAMGPEYLPTLGLYDGAGALVKVRNTITGANVMPGASVAFYWTSYR